MTRSLTKNGNKFYRFLLSKSPKAEEANDYAL